jgi:hypothetical protein
MPVSGVGIAVDPVLRAQMDRLDRVLLLPFLLTDTDSLDNGSLIIHTGTSENFSSLFYTLFSRGTSILSCCSTTHCSRSLKNAFDEPTAACLSLKRE